MNSGFISVTSINKASDFNLCKQTTKLDASQLQFNRIKKATTIKPTTLLPICRSYSLFAFVSSALFTLYTQNEHSKCSATLKNLISYMYTLLYMYLDIKYKNLLSD